MKQFYILLVTILFTSLGFGQGSIDFDTAGNWSPTPSGYGNYTYTDGVFTATGVDVLRNGTTAQDGFPGAFGTYSVRLRNNTSTSLTMIISSGGVGTFSFKARRWDGSPATNFQVETTIDNGSNWTSSSVIDATVTTDSDWKTVNGTLNSGNTNVGVRIVSAGSTERLMVDDFTWTAFSGSSPTIGFDTGFSSENETDTTFNTSIAVTMTNYDSPVTISVAVNGSSTAEGGDYTLNTASLSFSADETKNISLDINDDADSDNETVILDISETTSTGITISTNQHTVTIIDDDLPNILISEIMYNSPSTDDEWLEIYNADVSSVDISGWTIDYNSGTVFTFPGSTTIASGAYLTIALGSNGDGTYNNDNPFTPDFNSLSVANSAVKDTDDTNNLGNTAGTLEVKNGSSTIDSVNYDDGDASSTDGNGPSYEIIDTSLDNSLTSANWQASAFNGGSPGGISSTSWTGATDNDWSTSTNWSAGLPTANSDILIANSGNPVLSGNTSCNNVIINAGSSLTVNSSVTLTANRVTLESTSSSFSSLILDGSISGTVNYNRYTSLVGPTGTNDLISPPVTGQQFDLFATANTNLASSVTVRAFAPFDNSLDPGDYVNYTTSTTTALAAGKGYRAATSDGSNLTFEGTVNTGTVNVGITQEAGTYGSWNLIGNPYPSYISFKDFFDLVADVQPGPVAGPNNQLDGLYTAVYGYDGNASDGWTVWDFNNTNYATDLIAPGQGFFVASKTGGGSVDFTPSMRRIGSSDDFISGRTDNGNYANTKLFLTDSENSFNTNIYFRDFNTKGLDPGYDTGGHFSNDSAIFTHLVENNTGVSLVNQSLPFADLSNIVVPLGINSLSGTQITIGLDSEFNLPAGINVYLEDNFTNQWTLLNTNDYVFTPTTNLSGTGRFFVHFTTSTLSAEEPAFSGLQIYSDHISKELVIKGQINNETKALIYDLQGRQVMYQELNNALTTNKINVNSLSTGLYIVEISDYNKKHTHKVIIK